MRVLVTGGCGFIGSHTSVELLNNGHSVAVFDNCDNSSAQMIQNIEDICGTNVRFYRGDLRNRQDIERAVKDFTPEIVVHFAGLKSVADSFVAPLEYYSVNVVGTLNLIGAMQTIGCDKLVFSSSATVYGNTESVPINEQAPLSPVNPYGNTKYLIERLLSDWAASGATAVCLRYFNPVGAHRSGLIGENPTSPPTNIMPIIGEVALGIKSAVVVFGDNLPTRDGSGERDFVHIVDLARAHVAALNYCSDVTGFEVFNVGTGKSTSVLELCSMYRKRSGRPIKTLSASRREGDVAISLADVSKVKSMLGWSAELTVEDAVADAWNYLCTHHQEKLD